MTELLIKIFIKNRNNVTDHTVRKNYGTLSGAVGIATNIILTIMKLVIGMTTFSVAIIADAFNNLSDAGASLITLISFKLSSKPADKEHPFGHARLEYIASMIVSFLIMLVGVELFIDSFKILIGIGESKAVYNGYLTILILSVSILLKLWLGIFYRKIGKKINSKIIYATATDSIIDSVSTGSVLISAIVIQFTGFALLDAIIGICLSGLIIFAGAKILNETKNALLGEAPVKETVDDIKAIVKEKKDIIDIHDLLVHNYGPGKIMASFHAEVDGKKDIYELHDIIDKAEREIKESLGISCTIHIDPIITDNDEVNGLKNLITSILKEGNLNYSIHDFRVVFGKTNKKLIFDIVLPYDSKISENELISTISEEVKRREENCYCIITVDRE